MWKAILLIQSEPIKMSYQAPTNSSKIEDDWIRRSTPEWRYNYILFIHIYSRLCYWSKIFLPFFPGPSPIAGLNFLPHWYKALTVKLALLIEMCAPFAFGSECHFQVRYVMWPGWAFLLAWLIGWLVLFLDMLIDKRATLRYSLVTFSIVD